jgi:peptidylamidoglycolate lyase
MTMFHHMFSRRSLLRGTSAAVAAASVGVFGKTTANASARKKSKGGEQACDSDGDILGQGDFQYRVNRHWGLLERAHYPVKDGHGITEDHDGRIILLTNDTHNNLIAYSKDGGFLASWENRFPSAHGLEIYDQQGEDRYWITDNNRQVVSLCTADGRELRKIGPDVVAAKYPSLDKYHPTNVALAPDGDFFVSDGYGSSFIHHFDPNWRYISTFGGLGDAPSNLHEPHSVWLDTRSGKPLLLVCDRANEMLKWFSLSGELLRMVPVPGARPSNVVRFGGYRNSRIDDHLAIASLNGMILILDGADRVVSVVGGEPPVYVDGKLQPLQVFNYTFNHPHDVYIDADDSLYVAQWWSNQSYPIKLERLRTAVILQN